MAPDEEEPRCSRCRRLLAHVGAPHDCRTMEERIAALQERARVDPPRDPIVWRAPELVEVPDDAWHERRDLT